MKNINFKIDDSRNNMYAFDSKERNESKLERFNKPHCQNSRCKEK